MSKEKKTGRRLVLMDGEQIEDGTCGLAEDHLWCWLPGFTMQEAAETFFNPDKTGRITFEYGNMSDVYEGYTNCVNIYADADKINVCMIRG